MKKSYIGLFAIILIFGIWTVKELGARFKKSELATIGSAPKFSLTNQNGQNISDNTFKDKVYVVEFFFSKCPTICPKMNQNMLKIEKEFLMDERFGIVSISIDPENDTPQHLKQYAKLLGVSHKNWHFLTGKTDYIFDLAKNGFNLYANKNDKVDGGFEHSGMFALIDKDGNIRCRKDNFGNPIIYYDGLETSEIEKIKTDIKELLKE